MSILESLQTELQTLENEQKHDGYWYHVSDALSIMICGLLCGLENISDIHSWAKSRLWSEFFHDEFGMKQIMSRSQFY